MCLPHTVNVVHVNKHLYCKSLSAQCLSVVLKPCPRVAGQERRSFVVATKSTEEPTAGGWLPAARPESSLHVFLKTLLWLNLLLTCALDPLVSIGDEYVCPKVRSISLLACNFYPCIVRFRCTVQWSSANSTVVSKQEGSTFGSQDSVCPPCFCKGSFQASPHTSITCMWGKVVVDLNLL